MDIGLIFYIFLALIVISILYYLWSFRDFLRHYGCSKKGETKGETKKKSKGKLRKEAKKELKDRITIERAQDIINKDTQRIEEEEECEKRKEAKTKEILKRKRLISTLIMKAWYRDKANSEIVKLEKGNKQRITIKIYGPYTQKEKGFPSSVVIILENLPGFQLYYRRELIDLNEKELERIENWINEYYKEI